MAGRLVGEFETPQPDNNDMVTVVEYDPQKLIEHDAVMTRDEVVHGIIEVNRRGGRPFIPAGHLTEQLPRRGTLYLARTAIGQQLAGYGEVLTGQHVTTFAELEAIDADLGTGICRFSAAAIIVAALSARPKQGIVAVEGHQDILETRSLDFFTALGFAVFKGKWGHRKSGELPATLHASRKQVLRNISDIYQIP